MNLRINGPDGIAEDEIPKAAKALARIAKIGPGQAEFLIKALCEMKLWAFEIPNGTDKGLKALRAVHLNVELIGPPTGDPPKKKRKAETLAEVFSEDQEPIDPTWIAWLEKR